MNSDLILIALIGLMSIAIDGFLWGMTGYVLFKIIRVNDKYWIAGALAMGMLYFVWEELILGQIISRMGMQINNESITNLIGEDLMSVDVSDVVISFVALIIGFKISQRIISGLIQRSAVKKNQKNEDNIPDEPDINQQPTHSTN